MSDEPSSKPVSRGRAFAEKVGAQAARKLEARRSPGHAWFGLGMMGLIGWSVAILTRGRWRS